MLDRLTIDATLGRSEPEVADDVCALSLVRRVAAMLDQEPSRWRDGDALPRGWHIAFFTMPTRQSELRADGVAGLGAKLPELGLPRIMLAGKRTRFEGDVPIGAPLKRVSRLASITPKDGRSGPFVIVTIRHEISVLGAPAPSIVEEQDYVMRPAADERRREPAPASAQEGRHRVSDMRRGLVADETLLFRYSAVTFNTHRIHYDHPYATGCEGYPRLVVNGGIPILFFLEMFKAEAGRQPTSVTSRNIAPLFCGTPIELKAQRGEPDWLLWAEDDLGRVAVEMSVR